MLLAAFRVQECGWRDPEEYQGTYGIPERWADSGLFACVRTKDEGAFVYWRRTRECEDRFVTRVRVYSY